MSEEQTNQEHSASNEAPTPDPGPARGQTDTTPQQNGDSNRIARLEEMLTDATKRIGKLNERLRSLGSDADDSGAKPGAPGEGGPSLTPDDLDAAMTLGEKRAKLPQSARDRLDAMRKSGRSYKEVGEFADMLLEALAESKGSEGAKPSEPPTRDHPASGPRQTNGASVRTYKEYQDLAHRAHFGRDAEAKRRIDALHADPDFLPSALPLK